MERSYLSSYNEILTRRDPCFGGKAKIFNIESSQLREDTFICIFLDGSQCNINTETRNKLK